MISAQLHPDEEKRLQQLYSVELLDTLPDEHFDFITRTAAQIVGAEYSLISLVDRDRQWFKSSVGLGVRETPRDIAFCAHAILGQGPFIVPNAAEDARFSDNPLVSGDLQIKFYAGVPVLWQGLPIGTLCVAGKTPMTLNSHQISSLEILAREVTKLIDLNERTKHHLRLRLQMLREAQHLQKREAELYENVKEIQRQFKVAV